LGPDGIEFRHQTRFRILQGPVKPICPFLRLLLGDNEITDQGGQPD
jgi:hypothetical protein